MIGSLLIVLIVYFILFIVVFINSIKRVDFLSALGYTITFIVVLMVSSTYLTKALIDKLLTIHYIVMIFYYIISFLPAEYLVLIINLLLLTLLYNIGIYIYDMLLPYSTQTIIQSTQQREEKTIQSSSPRIKLGETPRPKIKSLSKTAVRKSSIDKAKQKSKINLLSSGVKEIIVGSEEGEEYYGESSNHKSSISEIEEGGVVVDETGNIVFIDNSTIRSVEHALQNPNEVKFEKDDIASLLNIGSIEDIGEIKIRSKRDVILIALRELSKFIMFEQIASDPMKINDPQNYKLISGPKPLKTRKKSKAGWILEIGFKLTPLEYYVFKVFVSKDGKTVKIKPIEIQQMLW